MSFLSKFFPVSVPLPRPPVSEGVTRICVSLVARLRLQSTVSSTVYVYVSSTVYTIFCRAAVRSTPVVLISRIQYTHNTLISFFYIAIHYILFFSIIQTKNRFRDSVSLITPDVPVPLHPLSRKPIPKSMKHGITLIPVVFVPPF